MLDYNRASVIQQTKRRKLKKRKCGIKSRKKGKIRRKIKEKRENGRKIAAWFSTP